MTDINKSQRGGNGGRNRGPKKRGCAGQWNGHRDEQRRYRREETKDEEEGGEHRSQSHGGRDGSGECLGASGTEEACLCGSRYCWNHRNDTPEDVARQSQQSVLLFVRNLPSRLGRSALKQVFAKYGEVKNLHLMQGRSVDDQSCAFVRYQTCREATLAVNGLHGIHEMRPGFGPITMQMNAPGVFVENLSAGVRQEMLAYVFSLYGHVQTVHIFMGHSLGGRARAFIEYRSKSEAQAAISALDQIRCYRDKTLRPDAVVSKGVGNTSSSAGSAKGSAAAVAEVGQGMSCGICRGSTCVICLSSPRTHAFIPCGHCCVCSQCGEATMELLGATCPICRAEAKRVNVIFY